MTIRALFQLGNTSAPKKETIRVGGQEFVISPQIKMFIGGKAVKAKEVQDNLKIFSQKELEQLKTQLENIQKYSDKHPSRNGSSQEIERYDFEACSQDICKKQGVSYSYDEDDGTIKLGCVNGKFEIVW